MKTVTASEHVEYWVDCPYCNKTQETDDIEIEWKCESCGKKFYVRY